MSFYRSDFWGAGFWHGLYWGTTGTPPTGDLTFFRSQFWKAGFWKARFWGPEQGANRSAGYVVGGRWLAADLCRLLAEAEAEQQHRELLDRMLLSMRAVFQQLACAKIHALEKRQIAYQQEQRRKALAAATLLLAEL